MFAIDGPIVRIRAFEGRVPSIQRPVSRPPGTPPEPARKVPLVAGVTRPHVVTNSDAAITPTATGTNMRWRPRGVARRPRRPGSRACSACRTAWAASSATAGAVGSRY